MDGSTWQRVAPLAALQASGCKLFRKDGRQIVVFHTPSGVFACNNRCPHEGYPLMEGSLDDNCVLTCNWHNWKFDLSSGENLYGGDRLRIYPTAVRDDAVWIDIADPPLAERRAAILESLRDAFDDNAYERMGREIARLKLLGTDPVDAVRHAVLWSAERMEFGWTHGFAGAADWLTLYDEHPDDAEIQLVCLLETVAHLADDVLRERVYPFAPDRLDYDAGAFVAAIEAEDEPRAAAMVRGGLAAGLGFEAMEEGFARAALAHYNDFGHSLIYTVKAGRLIRRLGPDTALPLLLSLTRSLVFANREDRIPEFRRYGKALQAWDGSGHVADAPDYQGLSINQALDMAVRASGVPVTAHYAALLRANALNMLTYNTYYQTQTTRPVQDNVGWLDFTHGLTFASAVRLQCGKFPALWPNGLLQLACFVGRNSPYTEGAQETGAWHVPDPETFMRRTVDGLFDHGREEFIVSVHLLKTALAVREEIANTPEPRTRDALLAALNRFLHEPLKRKHARRTARQSLSIAARDFAGDP